MEEETLGNEEKTYTDPITGKFVVGNPGGGRPKETEQDKIVKKATKQLIEEYKEALGEALPLIKPVLIAKAMEGDISAIKEIHDRVMDKAKQPTDVTTNGKDLPQPILNVIQPDNSHQEDNKPQETN
jgi:hypothetical protein